MPEARPYSHSPGGGPEEGGDLRAAPWCHLACTWRTGETPGLGVGRPLLQNSVIQQLGPLLTQAGRQSAGASGRGSPVWPRPCGDGVWTPWGAACVPARPALSLAPPRSLEGHCLVLRVVRKDQAAWGHGLVQCCPPGSEGLPPAPGGQAHSAPPRPCPSQAQAPSTPGAGASDRMAAWLSFWARTLGGAGAGGGPETSGATGGNLGPHIPALPTPSASGRDPRHPHKMLLEMLLVITPVSDPEHLQKPLSTSQTLKATLPPWGGRRGAPAASQEPGRPAVLKCAHSQDRGAEPPDDLPGAQTRCGTWRTSASLQVEASGPNSAAACPLSLFLLPGAPWGPEGKRLRKDVRDSRPRTGPSPPESPGLALFPLPLTLLTSRL